jgi:hypothetical protein
MADEISITKVHGCEEVSKPTTHLLVRWIQRTVRWF